MTADCLDSDLEPVLARTSALWAGLQKGRVFMTGGTGFWGQWLLESFLWANREFSLGAKITILTRDEDAFQKKNPRVATSPELSFQPGDVRSFDFPKGGFTHVIHAATDGGAARVFDFAAACGASHFLLTSSGAVYRRQPADMTHIPEDYPGSPEIDAAKAAYAEDKRLAERLGADMARKSNVQVKIARGFAFVGPYMAFDAQYAIGNFIQDAAQGKPIEIRGDGTAYRSYLYGADLAVWLWTILLRGQNLRPYNVGSENRVSTAELAQIVRDAVNPAVEVLVLGKPVPGRAPEQYVPSTARARQELGLRETVDLRDAIRRTADWFSRKRLKMPSLPQ